MVAIYNPKNTKPWYKSKTIWGLILIAVGEVLEKQGAQYAEALILIGIILATVGRILANAKLTLK